MRGNSYYWLQESDFDHDFVRAKDVSLKITMHQELFGKCFLNPKYLYISMSII